MTFEEAQAKYANLKHAPVSELIKEVNKLAAKAEKVLTPARSK